MLERLNEVSLGWFVIHRNYSWQDERGKKVKLPAPQYIDLVMSSVEKTIQDEQLFPNKFGEGFFHIFAVSSS